MQVLPQLIPNRSSSDVPIHDARPARRRSAAATPFVTNQRDTPKAGKLAEFMERQLAQQRRLRGEVQGLVGSRLFRSADDRSAVLIAVFETEEDAKRFRARSANDQPFGAGAAR